MDAKKPTRPTQIAYEQTLPLSFMIQTSLLFSSFILYPLDPIDPNTIIEKTCDQTTRTIIEWFDY